MSSVVATGRRMNIREGLMTLGYWNAWYCDASKLRLSYWKLGYWNLSYWNLGYWNLSLKLQRLKSNFRRLGLQSRWLERRPIRRWVRCGSQSCCRVAVCPGRR